MTGQELRALRESLPRQTSASEIARRIGYTRQYVSFHERSSAEAPAELAKAYAGAIVALRAEQARAGEDSEPPVRVTIMALSGMGGSYAAGLDWARAWIRENPKLRRIIVDGLEPVERRLIAAIDALDRAGVDVSFYTADRRREFRSKRGRS